MPLRCGKLFLMFCYFSAYVLQSVLSPRVCVYIVTSQFISALYDPTRFCLMCVFTELNLRTPLRAIFVLCDLFHKPAFPIICSLKLISIPKSHLMTKTWKYLDTILSEISHLTVKVGESRSHSK